MENGFAEGYAVGRDNNNGYGGGGFGYGFGDAIWIILLFALFGCGWGGMGFGGGFGGGLGIDFPWLLNGQNGINNNVNDGFRTAQLQDSVTSVRDSISALSTQLCGCCGDMQMSLANGFAGTNAAITNAQNSISQQMYSNEIANLNRSFAEQTANVAGFNGVNSGLADLKYTVAMENCNDRQALNSGVRDIIANQTQGIQTILDKMCQDKIDQKNDTIAQLRQELLYARGQASQVAQNSAIINGVYNRLNECPIGTVPVYGEQPIFTCPNNNSGCGCGCGNN